MIPIRLYAPVELENREAPNRIRLPEPCLAECDMRNSMSPNSIGHLLIDSIEIHAYPAGARSCLRNHRDLHQRQRRGVHQALGRLVGAVAWRLLRCTRGRPPRAVPNPLAGERSGRSRQQRDRARRGYARDARKARGAKVPNDDRWTASINPSSCSGRRRNRHAKVSRSGTRIDSWL